MAGPQAAIPLRAAEVDAPAMVGGTVSCPADESVPYNKFHWYPCRARRSEGPPPEYLMSEIMMPCISGSELAIAPHRFVPSRQNTSIFWPHGEGEVD